MANEENDIAEFKDDDDKTSIIEKYHTFSPRNLDVFNTSHSNKSGIDKQFQLKEFFKTREIETPRKTLALSPRIS